jgi:hypothetical protein
MMSTSNLTFILSYCFVFTQENLEARDYFEREIVYKEFLSILKFNGRFSEFYAWVSHLNLPFAE